MGVASSEWVWPVVSGCGHCSEDMWVFHLLPFLFQEEGEGNDWLYAVITDIATTQNLFVHTLYANIGSVEAGEHPLSRLLTPEQPTIFLAETNEYSCLVGTQQT